MMETLTQGPENIKLKKGKSDKILTSWPPSMVAKSYFS